ncbi:cytidine deaminase family protein [Clostridium estertheticum]|uniref:Cytidine deaminase n=1 Tax=Clostridium estertheticum TaxID=238834 RepID=A0A7Y3SWM5_9CLOT|nr:cytidine deaminase [Clostridium estertheticum]NNU76353.1 cytidine deaminase [Clostridium estertheticum]WBL45844.1 cytidine deaminase [Clostridium estertheticum]
MKNLIENSDKKLIAAAKAAIIKNYDAENFNHTVGAAVACSSGEIYTGVNVHSLHGACAEQVAIGAAITAGERDFLKIVAVRGENGEEIIPPCGNCRQILSDYMPECDVLLMNEGSLIKVKSKELLTYAYKVEA